MPEVSIQRLRLLASVFEKEYGPAGPLLRACGISTAKMSDPTSRIAIRQEAEFVKKACEILNDPLFAARAGLDNRDAITLAAYVAKSCETLEQAIQYASKYLRLSDTDTQLEVIKRDGQPFCVLRSRSGTTEAEHRHREFLLFALLARLRRISGAAFAAKGMAFKHNIRAHRAGMEKLAGCPVLIDQPESGLMLTQSTLNLPISTADPELRAFLLQYGDNVADNRASANPPLADQVEAVFQQSLPGRLPTAEQVAQRVGLSRRSLTRKLTLSGRPYRTIRDDVRRTLAQTWLRDTHTLAEIAFLLDYADQAAFTTAFKRWTGMTPNAYRSSVSVE
ncbi:AraC-like DNA-binding protein [Shimia isoporae]|uniref:AraC-like DNA-binding protein n=1 Tax=Shimia isoporae TaxID=647720 RepID=A0A4R1NKI4_9RHOB|nr:AraC family transcriptional regulator [Shimia isoporae]TCL08827.1 AraC-like DNA-binding protein [Shimia isoporae]